MPTPELSRDSARPQELADQVVATVKRWLAESREIPADRSAERLAGVLRDPVGLEFTLGFVDRVVRPEDLRVAGRNLERLSHRIPKFLPWYLRLLIMIGGGFAPVLPWPIIPIARRVLRGMVAHLVIDATPSKLDKSLVELRGNGRRLNLNLLGEAVLGDHEAGRRLQRVRALVARPDVDYVSVKVSAVASQLSTWDTVGSRDRVVDRLRPLYRAAAQHGTFLNLDMEEYRDLALTVQVFEQLVMEPELLDAEWGIVLQAYLPDAVGALDELTEIARRRAQAGGARIKVRLVKGANLAMERVDAAVHGWPLAVVSSKASSDANFKRVLREALLPANAAAVRIGVASHNLFDLAYAAELARHHGTLERVDAEMLLGMAADHRAAVREAFPSLILYTPVVPPDHFDAAVAYLIRRLEENASGDNFMSSMADLTDPAVLQRERDRFLGSLELMFRENAHGEPRPNRTQNRLGDLSVSVTHPLAFEN